MNYIPMTCGNCDYNDGLVYTSLPPKSKCTITNEFYECDHKCHLVFTAAEPVKHGHWLFYEDPDGYYHTECSECGQWCDEYVFLKGKWHYCPNCGAKMDEKTAVKYYADNKPIQTTVINERREDEID